MTQKVFHNWALYISLPSFPHDTNIPLSLASESDMESEGDNIESKLEDIQFIILVTVSLSELYLEEEIVWLPQSI